MIQADTKNVSTEDLVKNFVLWSIKLRPWIMQKWPDDKELWQQWLWYLEALEDRMDLS